MLSPAATFTSRALTAHNWNEQVEMETKIVTRLVLFDKCQLMVWICFSISFVWELLIIILSKATLLHSRECHWVSSGRSSSVHPRSLWSTLNCECVVPPLILRKLTYTGIIGMMFCTHGVSGLWKISLMLISCYLMLLRLIYGGSELYMTKARI